jgi:hypothetical protein
LPIYFILDNNISKRLFSIRELSLATDTFWEQCIPPP